GQDVFWMQNGTYLLCTGVALLWVIIFRKNLVHMHNTFFVFDAIGLALFTIVGMQKTIDCGLPIWVGIIMGTMTGAAGGVIRDVLINEVPLIFREEIYAMACIVGGLVFALCMLLGMPAMFTHLACGAAVFLTRIIAVKYHICLPTLKPEED
ncbi:MAG: TRIC cation channel family protein, partial [Bacteroidaceae bacterium]|nr:TRIC cation channel family protein [Bacteroidaceae bacterium]